jgi:hypothetical protein
MNELWLRVEQQTPTDGILTLWRDSFQARGNPVGAAPFVITPATWTLSAQVRTTAGTQPGLFNRIGDTLRAAMAACPVWTQWLGLRLDGVRTYFEIIDPPGAAARLADLPWEFLAEVYPNGRVDQHFVNANRPILRVHSQTAQILDPLRQAKVLVLSGEAIAWAANGESLGFPGDDVVAALREFQSCNLCGYVDLIETPTLQALEQRLDSLMPDVLHFSGHGEISPHTNLPALVLNSPGNRWWWDTRAIDGFFRATAWRPRLVVLNACDSGAAAGPYASVMDIFAVNGVAAVIGSQDRLRVDSAPIVSSALYGTLVAKGTIDAAMVRARRNLGNLNNGVNWDQRDWGLPILSVAVKPENLFVPPQRAANLPDPETVVMNCNVLSKFSQNSSRTAQFVALGWPNERWDCLKYLNSANCIVITGAAGGGKSRLAVRSLRDAVFLDQCVRHVEVSSRNTSATFIDLLGAIIDGDPNQSRTELYKALDAAAFAEFQPYRNLTSQQAAALGMDEIIKACKAFESGLRTVSAARGFTLVLDQFTKGEQSFAPGEFKDKLLPHLWQHVKAGQIPGFRVIFVVRDDEYRKFGLDSLIAAEISLRNFPEHDYSKLFAELCRFRGTFVTGGNPVPATQIREFFRLFIRGPWSPAILGKISEAIEELPR